MLVSADTTKMETVSRNRLASQPAPLPAGVFSEGLRCHVELRQLQDATLHPHELFVSAVASRLQQWARPDWLDVGCGWHFDWPWEPKREKDMMSAANVVGIDPDSQAVARHRSISKRIVAQVETLPFASDSFDLVTANVVVEHVADPKTAFGEVFRVLKPGGYFLFRTPSARSYFVRVAKVLPQKLKIWLASGVIESRDAADIYPALYRANTPEIIETLCRSIGFQKLSVTITRARGVLGKVPALVGVERKAASLLGMTQGNLIVEVQK